MRTRAAKVSFVSAAAAVPKALVCLPRPRPCTSLNVRRGTEACEKRWQGENQSCIGFVRRCCFCCAKSQRLPRPRLCRVSDARRGKGSAGEMSVSK